MPNMALKNKFVIAGGTALLAGSAYWSYKHYKHETAEQLKEAGIDLFKKGDYATALEKFNDAAKKCKKGDIELKAICYQNAAACLEKLKRYEECILKCSEALKLKPRYLKALARRAASYSRCDKDEEALRDYNLLIMIEVKEEQKVKRQMDKLGVKLTNQELLKLENDRDDSINLPIPPDFPLEWLKYSVIHDPIVKHINQLCEPQNDYERILIDVKRHRFDDIADRAEKEASKSDSPYRLECLLLAARFYSYQNNTKKTKEMLTSFGRAYEILTVEEKWRICDLKCSFIAFTVRTSARLEDCYEGIEAARIMDPLNTDVLLAQAANAMNRNQFSIGMEVIDKILAIDKDHPYAPFYRAYMEFTQACLNDDPQSICRYISQMEELLNEDQRAPVFTYDILGTFYANCENDYRFFKYMDMGLTFYPGMTSFIMSKATYRAIPLGQKAVDDAIAEVCQRYPPYYDGQASYAEVCIGRGDYDKALECIQRALHIARRPFQLKNMACKFVAIRAKRDAQVIFNALPKE